MKVKATYRLDFEVTREVEIDDTEYADWIRREESRDRFRSEQENLIVWLNSVDDEVHSNVLSDWRTDRPLPKDFEFQWLDVIEVERIEGNGGGDV